MVIIFKILLGLEKPVDIMPIHVFVDLWIFNKSENRLETHILKSLVENLCISPTT